MLLDNTKLIWYNMEGGDYVTDVENNYVQLKEAMEAQFKRIQRQALLLGAQSICQVILDKILVAENQPKKMSLRDYQRLVKDIKEFAQTGLSKKINEDGEPEPTIQD